MSTLTESPTSETLDDLVEDAEAEFYRLLVERRVKKGRQADECAREAAAIVADAHGLDLESDDGQALLEALDGIAAAEFADDF